MAQPIDLSTLVLKCFAAAALVASLSGCASPAQANSLVTFCQEKGGELMDSWTCPASGTVRTGPFCKFLNPRGEELVFNGCTGANGKYGELFFKACVLHDFCYHNEPSATGREKSDCDSQLYRDAMELCEQQDESERGSCQGAAQLFYLGVKLFGRSSWNCSKNGAAYPAALSNL